MHSNPTWDQCVSGGKKDSCKLRLSGSHCFTQCFMLNEAENQNLTKLWRIWTGNYTHSSLTWYEHIWARKKCTDVHWLNFVWTIGLLASAIYMPPKCGENSGFYNSHFECINKKSNIVFLSITTGNGRSYTHIALDVLSPMELRTPSCPKSHTHFERPWNADDFMFKLVKRKV